MYKLQWRILDGYISRYFDCPVLFQFVDNHISAHKKYLLLLLFSSHTMTGKAQGTKKPCKESNKIQSDYPKAKRRRPQLTTTPSLPKIVLIIINTSPPP